MIYDIQFFSLSFFYSSHYFSSYLSFLHTLSFTVPLFPVPTEEAYPLKSQPLDPVGQLCHPPRSKAAAVSRRPAPVSVAPSALAPGRSLIAAIRPRRIALSTAFSGSVLVRCGTCTLLCSLVGKSRACRRHPLCTHHSLPFPRRRSVALPYLASVPPPLCSRCITIYGCRLANGL
jgi:hypothetical protein